MRARLRSTIVLVVVLAGSLAVAGFATRGTPTRITAEFTAAVGVYEGSEVRVLGVKVGEVTRVEPRGDLVEVDLEVDPGVPVAPDTDAVIVTPTLVSDRYVQLTKPWTSGPEIASGTRLDTSRTAVPMEIDDLYESVNEIATLLGPDGADADGALSELIEVGAANLDGNGEQVRQVLSDLGAASRTLEETGSDTFDSVGNLARLSATLKDNDVHVRRLTGQLSRVTATVADDRETLTEALRLLSGAMALTESFVEDNRDHLVTTVGELDETTRILVRQKRSLARTLAVLPVAVQNVLQSYDPATASFVSRGNPNDVTIWGAPDPAVSPGKAPQPQLPPATSSGRGLPLLIPEASR